MMGTFVHFFFFIEVVEHACGMASLQMGEYVSNVSNGIDTYSIREPLGVCAGICPFNFPAMIPLWVYLHFSYRFDLLYWLSAIILVSWTHSFICYCMGKMLMIAFCHSN